MLVDSNHGIYRVEWCLLHLLRAAFGPACVKSRTAAMILFLNRRLGATDVRLCGRD
jgi:hypothetical protein